VSMFPFDLTKLLSGRVRIVHAPISVAVPTRIADIVGQVSPYTVVGDWEDGGSTGGPAQVSRNLQVAGFNIQQTTGTVLEEPSEVTRQISAPFAEITPELLAMFEESPGVDTITAAANKGAEKQVPFGSILELTNRRIALIGRLKKSQVLVTEPGGATRGAMVAFIAHRVTLAADNAQISFGEGDLVQVPMTFTLLNDPTISTEGEEAGKWAIETASTIASS
jgi:hypothetical protein